MIRCSCVNRSLVVIAATLNQFNIPEAGLLLILGVDTFLDMGRSATNAVGNSIATAAVAKWEGDLLPPEQADAQTQLFDAGARRSNKPPERRIAQIGPRCETPRYPSLP